MKTYALYLLILCFSVIGCQKDIGNEEKPKNKKAKKYLPTEIRTISSEVIEDNSPKATESWVFPYLLRSTVKLTYKDDEGNLLKFARWDTVGSEKYYQDYEFEYDSSGLMKKVITSNGIFVTRVYKLYYNNGKLSRIDFAEPRNYGDPWEEYYYRLHANVYWQGDKIDYYESSRAKYKFKYNTECQLYAIECNSDFYYTTKLTYFPKNYFAKDVKNKEIIYLVLPGLFYPTCKDLASITDLSPEAGNFYCKFDNQYNEDDYPIVVKTDLKIYNGAFYHTQNQVKVNYKVIE